MHRVLGLARVEVGTGRSDRNEGGGVRLDGLTAVEAAALREELLHRRPPGGARRPGDARPVARPPRRPRRSPRSSSRAWTRAGSGTRPSRSRASSPSAWCSASCSTSPTRRTSIPRTGVRRAIWPIGSATRRVVLTAVVLAVLALVAVVVASTVGYALAFWDFRLTRHSGGTLHVSARAHHHPRDDDRGAPAARRRDQRAAAAADGRGRAPDRHRHRPARRPRRRARRVAARAPAPRAEVQRVAAEVIGARSR